MNRILLTGQRLKPIRNIITRSLSSLRRQPLPTPQLGSLLPQDAEVDEEIIPGYESKRFYPAKPGEILDDRYQILVKVGWGTSSTVWFARDMRGDPEEPERAVALKITNNNCNEYAAQERKTEELIAEANPNNPAHVLLRTSSECFEITGPEGKHLCMAYEPLRDPLWIYQDRFKSGRIPLRLVKVHLSILLEALDYLHTECKLVHTDLNCNNIMLTFEEDDVLSDFLNSRFDEGMDYKIDTTGRPVYRCHNNIGPLKKSVNVPKLVDFGSSMKLERENYRGIYPIQPAPYRAPEIILGCGWRMSADMWNLGVLLTSYQLWHIVQDKGLFRQSRDPKAHLAEMIAFLGPPPPELIAKYHEMREVKWPEPAKEAGGELCESAEQCFGGPFFNQDGKFLYEDLIPDRKLEDMLPSSLEEEEKEGFLSFAKEMLVWLPEERKTARELAKHPFLRV